MVNREKVVCVKPTYNIYRLGDIFKVVKFKNTEVTSCVRVSVKDCDNKNDDKLSASFSRTRRVILEKALCNNWDWFCTFTLDPLKYDRSDIKRFRVDFVQFIRDQRKKGLKIAYLLVPELHSDLDSWHMHGLLMGSFDLVSFRDWRKLGHKVPNRLVDGDFYLWPEYHAKFGFCSFGRIRCPVSSAFYISKYMTKDNSRLVSDLGSNLYYCSQGLNVAVKHSEIYGHSVFYDQFLEHDFEFCQTGMTKLKDGFDWTFGLDLAEFDFESFEPLFSDSHSVNGFFDDMAALQYDQISLFDSSAQR